jgi:probable phosphomutase (TIGR03848 family)
MTTILLIRHGETAYITNGRLAGRIPGVPLNDKGRQEAARLAEALATALIKAIYSSPIQRAVETAEPLAKELNLPITIHPGLIETNAGDWQGKTIKQVKRLKLWKLVMEHPSQFCVPGGEYFADTQKRIVADLDALSTEHDEKELVACFSHGDPIKLAVAHYLGMPLDAFQRINIDTGSMTILRLGYGRAHLGPINQLFNLEWVK